VFQTLAPLSYLLHSVTVHFLERVYNLLLYIFSASSSVSPSSASPTATSGESNYYAIPVWHIQDERSIYLRQYTTLLNTQHSPLNIPETLLSTLNTQYTWDCRTVINTQYTSTLDTEYTWALHTVHNTQLYSFFCAYIRVGCRRNSIASVFMFSKHKLRLLK